MGGAGFEPAKAEPTDLQSVPFDRFGIPPQGSFTHKNRRGADHQILAHLETKPAEGVEPTTC